MIEQALEKAEQAAATGRPIRGTGFWQAVAQLRAQPDDAAHHADRIAVIDRRAFENGVKLRIPSAVGVPVQALVTAAGIVVAVVALRLDDARVGAAAYIVAFAMILGASHTLAHWLVGRAVGIRFTHLFVRTRPTPFPGVKTDYASYLRTSPRKRALMHASGAVVSKIVPFAMLPWAPTRIDRIVLVVAGAVFVLTDVFISTRTSDWMKVRRELKAARTPAR
jgi:hypothetical protein